MNNYNILFMGTSSFAVPILKELVNLNQNITKVFTSPPKKANRGMKNSFSSVAKCAEELSLPLEYPENLKDNAVINSIKKLHLDMIIVIAYGFIIPKEILSLPKYGCFNLHGSLLPRWRGAAPIQRAIIESDNLTGITFIKINEGLDTGDIMLKESIEIEETDNYMSLSNKLSKLGSNSISTFLSSFENELFLEKQNDDEAIYAEKVTKLETRIDWKESADLIFRRINAYNPVPGAWFIMNGKRIKIMRAEIYEENGKPGEVLNDNFKIACGKNSIIPTILKKEGKNETDINSFLRGIKIQSGIILD